ncbi:hypothetical protein BSKO_12154 [Bryopsis sp. KO-2023]|nr:hypothetical protein BSKO_12154 [Bryopsis sp. KO-2023]
MGELDNATLDFSELLQTKPEKVLQEIQDKGLVKLGDFPVPDSLVLSAFGSKVMLTRGRHSNTECRDWELFWRAELEKLDKGKKPAMGWSRDVDLGAYVLNVTGASVVGTQGLLHKVLLNLRAGSCMYDVMKLPALRATIDYKWNAWAGRLLMIELILYVGWLVAYSLFLLFFLVEDSNERGMIYSPALICNILSFLLMWPFLIIEIFTIQAYKWGWFSLWNAIDVGCYGLQMIIFIVYVGNFHALSDDWFSTCLAIESVLLFIRIQYYARAFGSVNVSFVDTLKVVLKEVRWFFFFVFLTISSFALAFGALFRKAKQVQIDNQEFPTESHLSRDFRNVWRAFLTTFSFMLGGFQTEYFFESDGWTYIATSMLFIIFEILIAVTLLNLLVAIMIDSYSKIKKEEAVLRDLNRAHVIDELEMTLPKVLTRKEKGDFFIHILVVKQNRGVMFPNSLELPPQVESAESFSAEELLEILARERGGPSPRTFRKSRKQNSVRGLRSIEEMVSPFQDPLSTIPDETTQSFGWGRNDETTALISMEMGFEPSHLSRSI